MQPSEQYIIAGLGEILWDIYGEKKYLGGAPANFALHIQRLGHKGIIISRVGKDPDGYEILDTLRKNGMDTSGIQIDSKRSTGTVRIELDEKGIPQFKCSMDTAFDYLENISPKFTKSKKLDAVLFGTLAQRNMISRQAIQNFIQNDPAKLIVFDINLRGIDEHTLDLVQVSLQHATIVKMNDSETGWLKKILNIQFKDERDTYHYLLDKYQLELICITLGNYGALLYSKEIQLYSPGFQIPVIDTTGSGDAFMAAFVAAYLENKSLPHCLERANALGGLVATKKGAVPEYHLKEIDDLITDCEFRNIDHKYEHL